MENAKLIFALATLSYFALTTNQNSLSQQEAVTNMEAQISAIGYGQQLIEQISTESFDEATTNQQVVSSTLQLTNSLSFGLDGSESSPDDVDDYDGMVYDIDTPRIDGFKAAVNVSYINPSTSQVTSTKTYIKQVEVVIWNSSFMSDSIKIYNWETYHNDVAAEEIFCKPY